MMDIHEFLMTFDDSGFYAAKDYEGFSADTKYQIYQCS
jgi:hypothetical protein